MSGAKLAALYGLIPNELGFCGPRQDSIRKFLKGELNTKQILPILQQFEAAYPYYCLIAKKNKIKTGPFNKKVVEAYWLGNSLLDKVKTEGIQQLILEKFTRPGLLSKEEGQKRANLIPPGSLPHHSFHVFILGPIAGKITFKNVKHKDVCRTGWGKVVSIPKNKEEKTRIKIKYQPVISSGKKLKLGPAISKEITWDKMMVPRLKKGDWVSIHWGQAVQVLNQKELSGLRKYTAKVLTLA